VRLKPGVRALHESRFAPIMYVECIHGSHLPALAQLSAETIYSLLGSMEAWVSYRKARVPVRLDAEGITELPDADLVAILRAADQLIMSGGRTLLSRILKGSRERKVLELKLDSSPSYGHYRDMSYEDILRRIDWVIQKGYLAIEYSGRLPLLVFTPAGWDIERDTYSTELLQILKGISEGPVHQSDVLFLKDKNRSLIMMLLDKIEASNDSIYIPILEQWKQIDYKKVRQRIEEVTQSLLSRRGNQK